MSDANVLNALDKQNMGYKRPALNNIIIYGRVRCIIDKPDLVGNTVVAEDGYFAILDAYALKCLSEDYFRDYSSYDVNSVYFTKGSILIFIDSPEWVGKDVKVFGKSKSYGATIRRQNGKKAEEGISAFMFGPPSVVNRRNVYPLIPNVLVELNSNDKDAKGTAIEDFLVSVISKKGDIPYPETLDSIIPYTGVENYNEIQIDTIKSEGNTSKNSFAERNFQGSKNIFDNSDNLVDISKIDMKLTYHLEGQPQSEYYEPFKEDITLQAKNREIFTSNALDEIDKLYKDKGDCNYFVLKRMFIDNIAGNPHQHLGISSVTCNKYLNVFLDNLINCLNEEDEGSKVDISSIKTGIEKLKASVPADNSLLYGATDDKDIDNIPMLNDELSFVVNVIGTCTGIGFDSLSRNLYYSKKILGIKDNIWMYMLLKHPYHLGLLSTGLSVSDCDIIYYSISQMFIDDEDRELNDNFRSYLIILDTLNSCSKGKFRRTDRLGRGINTFISLKDFKNADFAYPIKNLKNIENGKNPANADIKVLLEILLGNSIDIDNKELFKILNNDWYSDELFQVLCDAGVINTLDGFCALEKTIEQEFLIYETFEAKGKEKTGIDDELVSEIIDIFEKDRGFKLEPKQKEGIKLCKYKAAVLSGCAGSGKTTTSDCMTELIKAYDGEKVSITYCTPTGKACRRLAEVVHSTVKTIHSQFNVFIGGGSYLQSAYVSKKKKDGPKCVYILDEMAMCSTELMYNIAKNINENDCVYFLGDIKQLPPIGGGCPFKMLMTLLPCVELGVSKRAAEGSFVNYNTSLINFMSDGVCKELHYDGSTFIEKDCSDIEIPNTVKSAFIGFINGTENGTAYNEDDIQVITGYQKKERLSSTYKLNRPIQSVLRANDNILFYRSKNINGEENEPYYQNDRVIYVNKNSYDICRYIYDGNVFRQVATFGCVNGEMGKLVGIIKTKDVKISEVDIDIIKAGEGYYEDVSEEELALIKERFSAREENLRDDSSFTGEDLYFIVVKVYDTDLRKDVYVLLRGRGRFVGMDFCMSGSDLDNLNLAYALTCHKMQGSQSPVVIAVFESTGSPDFMNRNMINTIITRSQGVVCCIGSVLGRDSMLNRGRLKESKTTSKDLLSVLTGTSSGWLK